MKTFFQRLSVPGGLRKKRVVVPALAVLGVLLLSGLWFLGHSGTNSVWNTPSTPISDVLDRVDRGDIVAATISGQRILLTDTAGHQSWTIEKETSMSTTEQYLRSHNVKVAVQSTDDASFTSMLPNLIGLLLLLALLVIMLRRSNLLGNPMGAMTKHLAEARVGDGNQVTFDQVVGVDEAKHELEEVVEFLKAPGSFGQLGARMPRGILLVGPPGTGKTLLSRAVAGEAKVPYFSLSGSDFVEMFVGVGAARVRDLFRHAKKNAPCIVFLDEIDALGRRRGGSQIRTNEEREQTLNQLLVEMDGFNTDCAVVVIAATNRPDVLDPALLRSGRFDRRVAIDAPDLNGRRAILSLYAAQKPLADNINLDIVARQTPGFTGADLANLLNEAAILAARNKKQAIGKQELEEAGLRVMAGPEKRSRMITPEEKAIIAYHEVGHALVMKSIPKSDPVHKVSVVSRGQALGVTIQLPLKDRYLTSKSELIARMAAAMGGRAAEEIVFGDVTTGAKQDIEYATNIARQMVCEFGMSERLGLVTLHRKGDGDSLFFSELTAADVDAEVKALTDAAYHQAYEICESRRATLVRIADHLQLVETIDGEELDRLLLDEAVPVVNVALSEIVESAVAPRIAAAKAHDWDEGASGSVHDSDPGPPVAAG
ncbi:MAG: cell division protease FtsH [Chloroflexota bacterium]|jgi:cell division protease FtsH|nr:cell division protease FtsH [Chloroflexota bacterium]MEA2668661.1 cell division protease FtsH [Chloroflexota bacterium]